MEKLTESELAELDRAMRVADAAPTAKEQIEVMGKWLNFDQNRLSPQMRQRYEQVIDKIAYKTVIR